MKTNNLLKLSLLALLSCTPILPMNNPSTNQDNEDVNLSMAVLIYKILESSDKSLRVTGRKRVLSHSETNALFTNLFLQKKLKKTHACKQCGYCTTDQSNLTRHMRRHTGEKPFACTHQGCDFRARQTNDVTRHMRSKHPESFSSSSSASSSLSFNQIMNEVNHEN